MTSLINFSGKAFIFFIGLICLIGPICLSSLTARGEDVKKLRIAVLPVENLSGTSAPLKEIKQSLIDRLKTQGLNILDDKVLEGFMVRHRMRYTGGIDIAIAEAFRKEIEAEAVLITSLELYDAVYPPRIALNARLVSTEDKPVILWMDSTGLAGDDSPGILGLGLIEDPRILLKKALQILSVSLTEYLTDKGKGIFVQRKVRKKFHPKTFYRSPIINPETKYTIAVTPFFNRSERKNAGEIMVLHFVRELRKLDNFDVVEPGIQREELLRFRIIMEDGLSLANADLLFATLNADLILTGIVLDYQDHQGTTGTPKVDFSVIVIDGKSREVVWTSKSYNEGDDGVFFFDRGRVNTAHAMTSEMVRAVVKMMVE